MPQNQQVPPVTPEPEGEADAKPPKKRDCLTGCAMVALGLFAVLALVGGCWSHQVGKARRQFSAHVAALLDEFRAEHPEPPEEENAAALYELAFPQHVPHPDSQFYSAYGKAGPLWEETRDFKAADVSAYLAANQAYLAALQAAAARPGCDFRVDLSMGMSAYRASPTRALNDSVNFLCAAARNAAQSGRPAEALELLALGLRLARDAGRDGLSFTRQAGCEGTAAAVLGAVLNESDPDAAAVEKTLRMLAGHRAARPGLAGALRAQKLSGLAALDELNSGRADLARIFGDSNVVRDVLFGAWVHSGLGLKDARRSEKLMDEAIAAAKLACPQRLDQLAALQRRADDAPFWALGSGIGIVSFRFGARESDAQALARLDAARLGLGCRLHKMKFGAWPAALTDLPKKLPEHFPELPADPFTGKPFIYKPTPTGIMVYSVGKDRADDGGVPYDPRKSSARHDLVFELKK